MHNQINGTSSMDHETSSIAMHHRDNHHLESPYGHENPWGHQVDMHGYPHLSPHETQYPTTTYSFMPPILTHGLPTTHGLPSESIGRMAPPPPPHSTHPHPPMLVMPSWPSMLTNGPSYGPHSVPTLTIPQTLKTSKLPAIHTQPVPRKTLTDEDRKAMCQYAEDHPHTKQTEIGARFGVERSTVSKVLRNKEKYLYPDEKGNSTSSPIKRKAKGGVDIERALTNYVRNAQKQGVTVTDADIREKASLFSATMGGKAGDDSAASKICSTSWLEKFKQKNGIGQASRLLRRASETNISEHMARGSPLLSSSNPNSAISPSSPSVYHPSPSPLSANRSEGGDNKENSMSGYLDFNTEPGYKHSAAQSTTSLSSAFTDGGTSSFSSPTGPFSFSPDVNTGAFQHHLPPGGNPNFQRPRSQTFPTLDLEYMNAPSSSTTEPLTPRYHHISSTAPSSALESPATNSAQQQPSYTSLDQIPPPSQLRHSSSNTSLHGSGSPTQEDARKAADTLLSFIQSAGGFVDQSEYLAVVRLTEKLRLHQQNLNSQQQQMTTKGMGGLERIAEGEGEMREEGGMEMEMKVENA